MTPGGVGNMSEKNYISREGLYIMVFIILMNTCSMEQDVRDIEQKVDNIETKIVKVRE